MRREKKSIREVTLQIHELMKTIKMELKIWNLWIFKGSFLKMSLETVEININIFPLLKNILFEAIDRCFGVVSPSPVESV
jgi:hypothetical protein